MKMINNFLIIFLSLFIKFIKSININAITFDVNNNHEYDVMKDDFREYAQLNNIDITFDINTYTSENSTVYSNGGKITIQSLLKNESDKYDIYFYHFSHIQGVSEHLLNLYEYISPDIIEMYNCNIFRKTCIINDRLVGFPLLRSFTALYSNIELLNKYSKPIPKTWEELLDTSNYIVEQEKSSYNHIIPGICGLYGDDSSGSTSLFEMLYSYRLSRELYYPKLKSQEAIDALEMYKKIYDVASSGYSVIYDALESGESVFIKYWGYDRIDDKYSHYKLSPLPGWKEGISVSILGGLDIGINNHIDDERKKAAAHVVSFLLSREEQKRLINQRRILTGIRKLYSDSEVCSVVDCNLYRNLQLVPRFHYEKEDFEEYSDEFRKRAYEFITGNKTAVKALDSMNDLTYIHKLSLNREETYYGLTLFIVIIFLSLIFIGSSLLITTKRFKPRFKYLPTDFWYVILLGLLCHLASNITDYGNVLPYKCHLKVFLYCIGYTFIFVPFLYKLIVNFPEQNRKSYWVANNRYIFLLGFVFFDALLSLINLVASYSVKTVQLNSEKKYQECQIDGILSKVIVYSSFGYKILFFIVIGLLCFAEWNIKETEFDIHVITSTIYINTVSIIMLIVFKFIKFNNYITYCVLCKIFIFIIILSNYIVFIGIRIMFGIINKKKSEDDEFSDTVRFKQAHSYSSISSQTGTTSSGLGMSKYRRVINYHYQTSTTNLANI